MDEGGNRKEKQEEEIGYEDIPLAMFCYNFASWWYPPSTINPVYITVNSALVLGFQAIKILD
jgi:hypothetical protein